jgi:hypothetical protein
MIIPAWPHSMPVLVRDALRVCNVPLALKNVIPRVTGVKGLADGIAGLDGPGMAVASTTQATEPKDTAECA